MNAGCQSGERPIEELTNYVFLVPLFEDLSYDCGADGETPSPEKKISSITLFARVAYE